MPLRIIISLLVFLAAYLLVRYGREPAMALYRRQLRAYHNVLRQQLLSDFDPKLALWLSGGAVIVAAVLALVLLHSLVAAIVVAAIAALLPMMLVRHLEQKRLSRLNTQLIDGLTTLSSGVRAGLTLTQAMELIVQNHTGPIQQEFAQLLREYQMGLDLNAAMHNASNRIGSPLYRLTFTAIQMHRIRGGDSGESLDRIAASVREIQRLEGKLDSLTAQGRSQALMMAAMPIVFIAILWVIDAEGIALLFSHPIGRILLLTVAVMIALGFLWIRKILALDL